MKQVRFLSTLAVEEVTDQTWQLTAPFRVSIDDVVYTVPAGFVSDFASVPRIPIAYLLFGDTAHRPACLHDWLYSGAAGVSRQFADETLMAAMKADGESWFRRQAMYRAVRLFGEKFYKGRDPH
jgi:hypothetical protein